MENNQPKSDKSTLEKLRGYGKKWDETTGTFWDRQSDKLKKFEEEQTRDPEDTVVGPALATGSSMIRDLVMPPKYDPNAPKRGEMVSGPRGAFKILKSAGPAAKKEARAASALKKVKEAPVGTSPKAGTLDYKLMKDEIAKTQKLERIYNEKKANIYNKDTGTIRSGIEPKDVELLRKLKNTLDIRKRQLGL